MGRHVVESSGALILKDVRPGDEGDYGCRAENLLGSVNATTKLIDHRKFIFSNYPDNFLSPYHIIYSPYLLYRIWPAKHANRVDVVLLIPQLSMP